MDSTVILFDEKNWNMELEEFDQTLSRTLNERAKSRVLTQIVPSMFLLVLDVLLIPLCSNLLAGHSFMLIPLCLR